MCLEVDLEDSMVPYLQQFVVCKNFQCGDSFKFIDAIHAGNGEIDLALLSHFSIKVWQVFVVSCKRHLHSK